MKIEASGYVKNGKLHLLGRKRIDAEIKQQKNCDVTVVIKTKGKRSGPQNDYYWGCVLVEIRNELIRLGHIKTDTTRQDLHEALKLKFCPEKKINEETGEVLLEVGRSTASMNKEEFSIFLEKVIYWCANSLELQIPEPNTQSEMFADQ